MALPRQEPSTLWLAVTGAIASVPALLLFNVPLRENLAYVIDGYRVPEDSSWGHVASGYLPQLRHTIETNLEDPLRLPLPPVIYLGLSIVVVCVLYFFIAAPKRDVYTQLARGAIVGGLAFILIAVNPQGYRLELVFVPPVAMVLAYCAQRLWRGSVRSSTALVD